METLPLPLLIFLIVVAVIAGLWVGGRANREVESQRKEGKTIGARMREAATGAAVSLFRWNRDRKRKAKDKDKDRE